MHDPWSTYVPLSHRPKGKYYRRRSSVNPCLVYVEASCVVVVSRAQVYVALMAPTDPRSLHRRARRPFIFLWATFGQDASSDHDSG